MIGARVGIACGLRCGIASGIPNDPIHSSNGSAPPKRLLIIGTSQSNGLGLCVAANVGLSAAYPAVRLYNHNALLQDPINWKDEGGVWTALQPRTINVGGNFTVGTGGVELELGRALNNAGVGSWWIAKMCIDGSGLENNWVNPAWPTSPGGGPSLQTQFTTFISDRIADSGATLAGIIIVQGEADAGESPDAADYYANLGVMFGGLRTSFGNSFGVFIHRLSNKNQGINSATIRAAEESFAAGQPNCFISSIADDIALRDAAHYVDSGYVTIGDRMAVTILDFVNGTTAKPYPKWCATGVPVAALSSGSLTVPLPQSYATNDIGVLMVSGIGQTPYATPAGWTQFPNSPQHDAASGTNTRLQMFWKRFTAGAESDPTVADVSGDDAKLGQIVTIRGCTTSGNPFDVTSGGTAAAGTSIVIPGATTTVANALVMILAAHHLDVATEQFDAWANSDLTSVFEQIDISTATGTGCGLGVATGLKLAAGTYGNTTVTLAAASTTAYGTIVFKP